MSRRAWVTSPENNHFCPQNDVWVHFDAVLTGRKNGLSLEALGYGFYGKRSLQKRCKKLSQKFTVRPGGAVAPSPPKYATAHHTCEYHHLTTRCDANDRIQTLSVSPSNTARESSDDTLFNSVINNPDHVLCSLLPPPKDTSYNMRKRKHDLTLPTEHSSLQRKKLCTECFLQIYIS